MHLEVRGPSMARGGAISQFRQSPKGSVRIDPRKPVGFSYVFDFGTDEINISATYIARSDVVEESVCRPMSLSY